MFKVIQTKVYDLVTLNNNKQEVTKTLIVYVNEDTTYEPHLISKYIDHNYGSSSLNTQKKYEEELKKF